MNPKFAKMLEKKKELSPSAKMAKMNVLKDMKDAASEAASDRLGLHKVSVMSDSPEGLEHGLEKAQQVVHGHDMSPEDTEMNQGGMAGYSEGGETTEEDTAKLQEGDMSPAAVEMHEENHNYESEEGDEERSEYEHEMAEDTDLDSIKSKIMHLMELQKKAESRMK